MQYQKITPVNMLLVGFAATWLPYMRDGPLAPTALGSESRPCQTNFWSHFFYLNNIVKGPDYCLPPTWFLAVDMHLYIVACILTLLLWRHRCRAMKLYTTLFVISCVFNGIVAYINKYQSFTFYVTPEMSRRIFRDTPSFRNFYTSTWGALPSCFLGLALANIQFEFDEKLFKLSKYKWFVYLHYIVFPILFVWPATGMFARKFNSSFFHAAYIALDTPFYCILMGIFLLGVINVEGSIKRFFGWRGWTTMARVSLTVMLLHWCVNMIISCRTVAYSTSFLDVVVDWLATYVITYVVAIPITVLLDIPMQKFIGLLMF